MDFFFLEELRNLETEIERLKVCLAEKLSPRMSTKIEGELKRCVDEHENLTTRVFAMATSLPVLA